MNTFKLKAVVTAMLVLVSADSAYAKNGNDKVTLTTTTTSTTSTSTQTSVVSKSLSTTPGAISAVQNAATTYVLYYMDTKKVSIGQELSLLANLLPYNYSACTVNADLNATPIKCGIVEFGVNQFYTYSSSNNLTALIKDLDQGVKQVYAANFRSPQGLIPGDSAGGVVHVHFTQPVSQFLLHVDAGQAAAPSISGISFVVNGNAATAVQDLNAGTATSVGVELASGFTELDIIPSGGQSQGFIADLFSVVPTSVFVK